MLRLFKGQSVIIQFMYPMCNNKIRLTFIYVLYLETFLNTEKNSRFKREKRRVVLWIFSHRWSTNILCLSKNFYSPTKPLYSSHNLSFFTLCRPFSIISIELSPIASEQRTKEHTPLRDTCKIICLGKWLYNFTWGRLHSFTPLHCETKVEDITKILKF